MPDLNKGWTQRQDISSNGDVLQNFSDVNRSNQVDLGLEDSVLARFRILQHQVEGSSNTLAQSINISDNISERGEIVQVLTRYIMLRVRPTQRRR